MTIHRRGNTRTINPPTWATKLLLRPLHTTDDRDTARQSRILYGTRRDPDGGVTYVISALGLVNTVLAEWRRLRPGTRLPAAVAVPDPTGTTATRDPAVRVTVDTTNDSRHA